MLEMRIDIVQVQFGKGGNLHKRIDDQAGDYAGRFHDAVLRYLEFLGIFHVSFKVDAGDGPDLRKIR